MNDVEIGTEIKPGETVQGYNNSLYSNKKCKKCGGKILNGTVKILNGKNFQVDSDKVAVSTLQGIYDTDGGHYCKPCYKAEKDLDNEE